MNAPRSVVAQMAAVVRGRQRRLIVDTVVLGAAGAAAALLVDDDAELLPDALAGEMEDADDTDSEELEAV